MTSIGESSRKITVMIRLLQFTDMHLRDDPQAEVRGVVPQRSFEQALYHARQTHWPPDGVLLTGDLANDEFDDSYARVVLMAREWDVPVIAIPGNHDHRENLRTAFDGVPKSTLVLDFPHWRVVGLDSHVPGEVHGAISAESLERLEQAAATRGNRRLLVALHHHPVTVRPEWMRGIGLEDAKAFRDRLARLHVRACVFGHVHHEWDSTENGVRYLGTPSTGRQFHSESSGFAVSDEPPAWRRLELGDDGGLETGVARVTD